MTIGEKILVLIHEKGISQVEFSRRTGIPPTTVSDWKGKRLNPSSDKILAICDVLEITPYELLSGAETAKGTPPESIRIFKGSDEFELVREYQKMDTESALRLREYLRSMTD